MSKNSLRRKKDFDQVFKSGQSFYNHLFIIKSLENNLNINRLGIIIGLKVSKKAVIRNKIKRQIREIFRKYIKENPLNSKDFVIIVSKNIVGKNQLEIENEFLKIINKTK